MKKFLALLLLSVIVVGTVEAIPIEINNTISIMEMSSNNSFIGFLNSDTLNTDIFSVNFTNLTNGGRFDLFDTNSLLKVAQIDFTETTTINPNKNILDGFFDDLSNPDILYHLTGFSTMSSIQDLYKFDVVEKISSTPTPTPEAGTVVLLSFGLLFLFRITKKKED